MSEESKPVRDPAEPAPNPTDATPAQPVESDESDGDDDDGQPGAEASSSAPKKNKKKKSKRQRLKDAVSSKSSDPEADIKKAIAGLNHEQLQDLLKMNPALAQEVGAAVTGAVDKDAASGSSAAGVSSATDALKKLNLQDIMTGLASSGKNVKDMASYKFWQTQPVPKFGEADPAPVEDGPIKVQKVEDIPKEPPKMMDGFEWSTPDLTDPTQAKEVYELLNGHYVEDDEAMFRFNYSTSVLKWAMMSPGWKKQWYVGVRATQSRKLVAFISAIPLHLRVRGNVLDCSEVNFICVHKKLRSKRLAPVLIKEVTRLINLEGIWQAIYTAGVVLPKPVSTCRYYHRALDWQKLYEVGFSPLPPNSKTQYQVRKYALPDKTATKGLREMQDKDVGAVQALLKRYLTRYDLAPEYDEEEMRHWFLHKQEPGDERVVYSYVVEDESKKITDFFSFYTLESSVLNNPRHSVIRAAYLFYYATETGLTTPLDKSALKTRLNALIGDALILAKKHKFDVFNALSLMDNALFLEQQKFGPGDGQLHYYLFNYRTAPIAGGVNQKNQLDEDTLSGIGFPML
ncbi:hypothetical protein RB595_003118 [Gaeumannomyces hyphopodioides]